MSVKSDLWTNLPAKLVLSPCTHIQRVLLTKVTDLPQMDDFPLNGSCTPFNTSSTSQPGVLP